MTTQNLNVWSLLKKSFLAAACVAFSAETMASDFVHDGILYDITGEKSVSVTGYEEGMPSILILDSVQYDGSWYKVTSIGENAFRKCGGLTSISAPNVTETGPWSFYECSSLKSVNLPNVTSIDEYAFSDCWSLSSVDFPSVTSIGMQAFCVCPLTSVSLGEVTIIGDQAFVGCMSLKTLELRQSDPNITIGEDVFKGVNDLGDLTLVVPSKKAVAAYKGNASWSNMGLGKIVSSSVIVDGIEYFITGEKSVEVVGYENGFSSDLVLDSVKIDESWYKVTSIGRSAFEECSSLTSISAPNVTSVEELVFVGCKSLTSADLPKVTEIPYGLFINDENLRSVSLGEVMSIDSFVFSSANNLDTLMVRQLDPNEIIIEEYAFLGVTLGNVTLIVPKGSKDAYLAVHQAMSIRFKDVVEKDFDIDPDATYVVITEKDGTKTVVKVDADVKVEWKKGFEIDE